MARMSCRTISVLVVSAVGMVAGVLGRGRVIRVTAVAFAIMMLWLRYWWGDGPTWGEGPDIELEYGFHLTWLSLFLAFLASLSWDESVKETPRAARLSIRILGLHGLPSEALSLSWRLMASSMRILAVDLGLLSLCFLDWEPLR